jgi:hypothetical protein
VPLFPYRFATVLNDLAAWRKQIRPPFLRVQSMKDGALSANGRKTALAEYDLDHQGSARAQ